MKWGQDSKIPEPESVTTMPRIFTENHGRNEQFLALYPAFFLWIPSVKKLEVLPLSLLYLLTLPCIEDHPDFFFFFLEDFY